MPSIDEMLMIEPPPPADIGPIADLIPRNVPTWLIVMTRM